MPNKTGDLILSNFTLDFQSKLGFYVSDGYGNLLTTYQILLYIYGILFSIFSNVRTSLQTTHAVLSDQFQLLLASVALKIEHRAFPPILINLYD